MKIEGEGEGVDWKRNLNQPATATTNDSAADLPLTFFHVAFLGCTGTGLARFENLGCKRAEWQVSRWRVLRGNADKR